MDVCGIDCGMVKNRVPSVNIEEPNLVPILIDSIIAILVPRVLTWCDQIFFLCVYIPKNPKNPENVQKWAELIHFAPQQVSRKSNFEILKGL